MQVQKKLLTPIYKFSIGFVIIALLIGGAVSWLRSGEEPSKPITEHDFDSGHVSWSIEDYPAKVLQDNLFILKLTDLSGAPIQEAKLNIKLDMLQMNCGDFIFNLTETEPGQYEGQGVPLMAGMWKATLTLQIADQSYTINRHLQAVH